MLSVDSVGLMKYPFRWLALLLVSLIGPTVRFLAYRCERNPLKSYLLYRFPYVYRFPIIMCFVFVTYMYKYNIEKFKTNSQIRIMACYRLSIGDL